MPAPAAPSAPRPGLRPAPVPGSLRAKLHGRGAVDQLTGIGAAHLEEHAEFELLECATLERALQVRQRVAPDEHMNADRWPILEQIHQILRRRRLLLAAE
jgi:hypothetical protein